MQNNHKIQKDKDHDVWAQLKEKKRVVIKIGSSSLTHEENGNLNLHKIEKLVRVLCELKNRGKDVVLVSSGAVAVGRQSMKISEKPRELSQKQALAAIGQARLMMTYERIFSEYSQMIAQVLLTKYTMLQKTSRENAKNTFEKLFEMGVIPVVNENDTVATHEIEFGDNDRLSAIVAALIQADLLILLSDIDGLYTDDPHRNPEAKLIPVVERISEQVLSMGKETGKSNVGTGGMAAKLVAAQMAADAGVDMVIANGENVHVIYSILNGEEKGTLFLAHENEDFDLYSYLTQY